MGLWGACLEGLSLAGQAAIQLVFVGRLTGKRLKAWHFALYFALFCAVELLFSQWEVGEILSIGAGALALYAVSRFGLGNSSSPSWLAAALAFYLSQLSFGIVNSVESVVFPSAVGSPLLYGLLAAAVALSFALCAGCYAAALKLLPPIGRGQAPYLGLLLCPSLFCFAAELYILRTAYRSVAVSLSPAEAGRHGALLLLQIMGLAALFSTLYVYRQLCRSFQAQAALESLTQAARVQKIYVAEAQKRYEQTKSFRHDVRNHLAVLEGLLKNGRAEEGGAYLQTLKTASEALSFPYQTGSPAADVLLGEKLGLAKDIPAEVSLRLPVPWKIDDFDLCVIVANALDNAVSACRACQGERFIRVSGRRQGDFYLLLFENSCAPGPPPPMGTGLVNIQAAAEKYRGAVLAEKKGRVFSLSVLLDIS